MSLLSVAIVEDRRCRWGRDLRIVRTRGRQTAGSLMSMVSVEGEEEEEEEEEERERSRRDS